MKKTLILIIIMAFSLLPFSYAANDFAYNRLDEGTQDLNDLGDVDIMNPLHQQVILYNESSEIWYNSYLNDSAHHVNASDYWITNEGSLSNINSTQMENNGGTLSIISSWLDGVIGNIACLLSGGSDCEMQGDIRMNGNDIPDAGDITANNFFGNVTGQSVGFWFNDSGTINTTTNSSYFIRGNLSVNKLDIRSPDSLRFLVGDQIVTIGASSLAVNISNVSVIRNSASVDGDWTVLGNYPLMQGVVNANTNNSINASATTTATNYLFHGMSMLKFNPNYHEGEVGYFGNNFGDLRIANLNDNSSKIATVFYDGFARLPEGSVTDFLNETTIYQTENKYYNNPYLTTFFYDVNFTNETTFESNVTFNSNINTNESNITNILSIVFNTTGCTSVAEGTLCHDADYDTLRYVTTSGQILQINQETTMPGKNLNGSATDGSVVYVGGATGNNPTFKLARADNLSTSGLLGVLTKDCNSNQVCPIVYFGLVHNFDTSNYTNGDHLYLSATEKGNLTTTPPEFPNNPIWVATVIRVHATEGSIFVFPRLDSANGITMNNLGLVGDFRQTDYKIRSLPGNDAIGQNVFTIEMNGTSGIDIPHLVLQPGGAGQASTWVRSGIVVPESVTCLNSTNRTEPLCFADEGNFTWNILDFNTTLSEGADWGITGELEVIKSVMIQKNLTVIDTIFSNFLGSIIDRITKIWAVDINASGNLEVGGNITGNFIGAEMYSKDNSVATPIPGSDTYVNVTQGVTEEFSNGVSISGGKMTIQVPGRYQVISSVSANDGGNKEFHMSVGINGQDQNNCHMPRVIATAKDVGSWSLSCSVLVNQSDVITLMVENVNDGSDVTANDMNFMITRMWNN